MSMKPYLLYILGIAFALFSCNQPTAKTNYNSIAILSCDSTNEQPIGAFATMPDSPTNYVIKLNGNEYSLTLKETSSEHTNNNDIPQVLVTIKNVVNGQTILNHAMPYNLINDFYNPAPNKYLLALSLYGGGSGYSGTLFDIVIKDTVRLNPIVDYNEISYWRFNKTGSEILFFQGEWGVENINSEEFESHFSPHKQFITLYRFASDTVITTEIGTTKEKYDFKESATDWSKFTNTERISKEINVSDFE